jgi:hypothetical protein
MRWRRALLGMAAAALAGATATPAASHWTGGGPSVLHPYYWAPKSFYGGYERPSYLRRECERRIVVDKPRGVFARRVWVC